MCLGRWEAHRGKGEKARRGERDARGSSTSSGDWRIFGSRRKQKFKAAVIPPYADSFPFVLRKPDSCHRAQLSPLILDVITDPENFTSCVRHNHL